MKVLIDTCILSEVRRPGGNPTIKKALLAYDEQTLFLSVLTVGEIAKGIFLLPPSAKKSDLTNWLNSLETQFSDRILPIDRETTFVWGEMIARAQKEGITIPGVDGLSAATALRYGLHVMTSNSRHFQGTGVFIIDPLLQE